MLARNLFFWVVAFALPLSLAAEEISAPVGEVVLSVELSASSASAVESLEFDLDALAALGSTSIETTTIWTEGLQTFEGIELATLIEALGVTSGTIKAIALNDYAVEIPVADAVPGGPIIAYKRNGAFMSVRDKGPLWVIFPYDADAKFRTEVVYSQSIWQLAKIEIVQ